ncbi:SDR family NAD(P)-dependent oxidoreductase [Sinomonas terrae]|uniref:SDR family NAD(P)-dependent oxidoreductase n=1 Tax=Sinomonas terrae TaxID=2908838 RepID=A0ABS9U4N4_9MICC|nr:SDR family NAD(P)-dependent oxidoreductase [Sinomonas terrae]MCH6471649.1 SDR family NAD(P)-dependent oxidoreductase [Sinomonas terrae]
MGLDGSRALITGASSGIGRAIALALAADGCQTLLTGRDSQRLAEVAAETGGRTVVADLSEPDGLGRVADAAASFPLPDLVVHAAGIGRFERMAGGTGVDDDGTHDDGTLLATNYLAPVRLTRALLPAMLDRGSGRLVFVGSIAGLLGVAGESEYAASKAALGTFAASLRAELSGSGVGVTTLIPGVVDTPFFERRGLPYQRRFPRPVPAARVATALLRALDREQAQVVVPGWLRVPIALQACTPQVYSRLAGRWG